MGKMIIGLLWFSIPLLFSQETTKMADVVYVNGKIWTVDPIKPEVEAFAVQNGLFLAVGTNDEILKQAATHTQRIDLGGKRVVPGFIDNHTHFISGGFHLLEIQLRAAKNEKEFVDLIADYAKKRPGRWIRGGRWDHELWPDTKLPVKELIDPYTSQTPVFVSRYDGHMALVNSFVLKKAKIGKDTPDPPGGLIVKDPKTGEPTGILKDAAMEIVEKIIPVRNSEELYDAAEAGLAEARRLGVTGIQDMSDWVDIETYKKIRHLGKLTARFYCRIPIDSLDTVIKKKIQVGEGDEWVRLGSLKGYADGSLGSSTALFFEPYAQDQSTFGLARDVVQDGRLQKWMLKADLNHLQICIHSIGDSANRLILNYFEMVEHVNPPWDRRARIEHAQHLSPTDIARFTRLGVIPSMQPTHLIDDGDWAEKRLGSERARNSYQFRNLIETGATLCFGSDWPVATLNPLVGIYSAVTRRTRDGKNPKGWIPEQKISVAEAVRAYTLQNAYASFEESKKGSISAGKLADFVVLDEDIFTIPPEQIENVKVVRTVVGGKTVYEK